MQLIGVAHANQVGGDAAARCCKCGNMLRQRYDEVGLPCSKTMGSPSPATTYAISLRGTPAAVFCTESCRDHVAFSYHLKSAWSHYDIHIGSLVVGCKSVGMRIASIPYVAQDVRFSA